MRVLGQLCCAGVILLSACAGFAADVVVVGGGAAGLSAAIAAREAGAAEVVLLEKHAILGGNMLIANGTVSAVDPERETEQEIASMAEQIERAGSPGVAPELADTLARSSASAVRWLTAMGVRWDDGWFTPYGSSYQWARSANLRHGGVHYVTVLSRRARALGVKVRFLAQATQLRVDRNGAVEGILVRTQDGNDEVIAARSVVLATGGFSANVAMRSRYDPRLNYEFRTTANPAGDLIDGATGEGIVMAQKLGARVVDMDSIGLTPLHGGRVVDYVGADIFVNAEGQRFVNEGASTLALSEAILKQPDRLMWVITDRKSTKSGSFEAKLLSQKVYAADSLESMARQMRLPATVLRHTLDRYNQFVREGNDRDFHKTQLLQTIDEPPYYFGSESVDVHYTSGGLAIDPGAHVLDGQGRQIAGLYAAGEVTGGVHGKNRMGGNALIDCFVFGRIAGTNAFRDQSQ